jgi:putative transposase
LIRVERRLNSRHVLEEVSGLFLTHSPPKHVRSDNGLKFIATAVKGSLGRLGVTTLSIESGLSSKNSNCDSFKPKLRDEFLDRKIVSMLKTFTL